MKFSEHITSFITRLVLLFVWGVLIIFFLYSPRLSNVLFQPAQTINIFIFPRVLDARVLTDFEQETGIKVHVSYYENNDELLVKIRQTQGEGYDLIFPSDYLVDTLRQEGLLQRLDKTKLDFFDDIHPALLHHYFDPNNEYSIPYFWGLAGIGIDKKFFHGKSLPSSWAALFNEQQIYYTVGMVNNAREAVLLAAFYLFGAIDNLSAMQLARVQELLLKQKKWVQAYTDLAPDYLLQTGSCPVAQAISSDILQLAKADPSFAFVIPQEGTFMIIDAAAIPIKSQKAHLVYKLLNYLYKPEVLLYHVNKFALFPPLVKGRLQQTQEAHIFNSIQHLTKIEFFRNVLSEKTVQELWLKLKAS
jgi:spermidine/putrescine transport system substrate-binding protein